MRIVLFQPDIALNVGAVIRTAACLNCPVDIILPCGFPVSRKALQRSGMDYVELAQLTTHASWDAFLDANSSARLVLMTTKGAQNAAHFNFKDGDCILFGRESAGAPPHVHARADERLRLPMFGEARALNLSISVAMTLTLAYQQRGLFLELE
ncbi:MAG: tRNA (cytidine(34)-2'-O)-methyltransferase [Pseudomonadota bacterium]